MKKRLSKTLIHYIVSYLIILILPVAVTVFVSYYFFSKAYTKEVIEGKLKSLSLQIKDYELKLQQMENIVRQLEIESTVFNYDLQYSIPARIMLTEKLRGYRLISNYIDDMVYYRRGDNLIYASTGTYSVDNYGSMMVRYDNWSQESIMKELNEVDSATFKAVDGITIFNGGSLQAATFLYPLPYQSGTPYASVMFRVREEKLLGSRFNSSQKEEQRVILNDEGIVLYMSDKCSFDFNSLKNKILSNNSDSGWLEMKDDKGSTLLVTYTSTSDYNWFLINIGSRKVAMLEVDRIRNNFSLLIWVSILVGILLLCFFSYSNYKPLQALKEHALLMFELRQGAKENKNNEFELAHEAFDLLAAQRQSLNVRLTEQRQIIRDLLLMRLVSGEFRNINEFNSRAQESGVNLKKAFFRVIVFHLEGIKESDFNLHTKLIKIIENDMKNNTEAFAYFNGNNRIVAVIGSDDRDDCNILQSITRINLDFTKEGLTSLAGVGCFYSETFRLYVSFMEASTALDYRNDLENIQILIFRDIVKVKDDYYNYPEQEMQEIRAAVINNRKDQLRLSLKAVSKKVLESKTQLFSRILAYETINTIFKAVQHNNYGFVGVENYCSSILEFNVASNANRMWEIVLIIAEDIAEKYMDENTDSSKKTTMEQILEYIEENFCNQDFSIQKAADTFELSINNLSQQFKRHTGQTPLEYVNSLKINKAKKMLSESDIPLREVVTSIGYYDESGFIRKFKNVVGMTPGEYRNRYRGMYKL